MQLDPAEKHRVWWKGALKGAGWNLLTGLAIGFVAAAVIFWAVPPVASILGISEAMGGVMSFVAPGGSFSAWPLMAFNGLLSSVAGFITGGSQAVDAYHQQKHNARDEAKLIELDRRTRAIEQAVAPSRHVQPILARGPRNHRSFEQAEAARATEAPSAPTIH